MSARLRSHLPLGLIIALFLICGLCFSSVTPLFEVLDEAWHYGMVKRLADGQGLPVVRRGEDSPWQQEGAQAPLYYALAAAVTGWVDTGDFAAYRLMHSENLNLGNPGAAGDKFYFYHTRIEDFPYQRTALAVHLARWLSLIMGAGTIGLTYALARKAIPRWPAAAPLAAALVAFNPEFVFISAQVSNDNLINLLGAALAYGLYAIWQQGFSRRRLGIMALLLGVIALTKVNGLALVGIAGVVTSLCAWRYRAWRSLIQLGILSIMSLMALSGWWYARNLVLYGDPFALDLIGAYYGPGRSLSLWQAWQELPAFHLSYWGVFGLANITLPYLLYQLYGWGSWLAAGGLVIWFWRGKMPGMSALAPLGILFGLMFFAALYWSGQATGPVARLMFPAIGAGALLGAVGLLALLPRAWHTWAAGLLAVALAAIALAVPLWIIQPVYATAYRRPPLAQAGIPAQMLFEARIGDIARLRGYTLTRTADGGLSLTLYWEALRRSNDSLTVFTHLFNTQGQFIVGHDSQPQSGKYPVLVWSPGELIVDPHLWNVPGGLPPGPYHIKVGMYYSRNAQRLPVFDSSGARYTDDLIVLPEGGHAEIVGVYLPPPPAPPPFRGRGE